jgi:cellulose biosynthesis protein BcsQ
VKILIVDKTAESQADLARKVNTLSPTEIESLDLSVNLCSPAQMMDRLKDIDILFLGPNLENAAATARKAKASFGALSVLLFVREADYEGGAFRFARAAGVRKVFSRSCDQLDLLQELLNIHGELLEAGKVMQGRLVVVTQAKGGVGATTFCAALAELCNNYGQRALLWDCDVESRDLSRAMMADGIQGRVLNDVIEDRRPLNRQSFHDAQIKAGEFVSVLAPPKSTAAGNDLLYHPDFVDLSQRMIDLARINFNNIIVDAGSRLGVTIGALLRLADEVVVVADDSVLGMMALDSYLDALKPIVADPDKVRIVFSGTSMSNAEVREIVDQTRRIPFSAWALPPVPFDAGGGKWPGSGKTLYGLGQPATRSALLGIASELGVVTPTGAEKFRKNLQTTSRKVKAAKETGSRAGMQGLMQRVMSFSINQN